MKRAKKKHTLRWKLAGIALAGIAAGVLLMVLSCKVAHSEKTRQAPALAPVSAAPAAPADAPRPSGPPSQPPARETAAQSLSGLLFMFSLLAFAVPIICIGWIVVDIHRSRPAWKTQKKYPRRR